MDNLNNMNNLNNMSIYWNIYFNKYNFGEIWKSLKDTN